jgi:mannose-6-phosphate isomerase-like protein (cupin superfamily)
MNESLQTSASIPTALRVAAEDRFGEHRGLGISSIDFKVSTQDSSGLFIVENTFQEKGGPARHLYYDQDEWFYSIEGEFIFEVGQERIRLKPGDSLLAPIHTHRATREKPPGRPAHRAPCVATSPV